MRGVWIEREVMESSAFRALSGTAMRVYLAFLLKRRLVKRGGSKARSWTIANNGEIEFTYKEAETKHGIKQGAFREARDRLVEVGLIDITESGAGLYKSKTLYAISERWRQYGTSEFKKVKRLKDARRIGYQKQSVSREWLSIECVGKPTRRRKRANGGMKGRQIASPLDLTRKMAKCRPRGKTDAANVLAALENRRGST